MSLESIRKRFKVPAYKGTRVEYLARCDGELLSGVITCARGSTLYVRVEGNNKSTPFHPISRLRYFYSPEMAFIHNRVYFDPPQPPEPEEY